jgi:peptide chain release factor 2
MKSGGIFDLESKQARTKELEAQISSEGFWNNQEKAGKIIAEFKALKATVGTFPTLNAQYKDLKELIEITDESDSSSIAHLADEIKSLKKEVDAIEFKALLSREEDRLGAILSINAGAGGTESCDWASMLLRMYMKWSDKKGYSVKRIDFLAGDEAGIKNVTVIIEGEYAYGYLKGENGVHRLVRISPFDANKRRHTSFASVDVIPKISDDIQVDINPSDLKIDTYRAGGKGGQHVNVTDSAVRITHVPTGIIVQCQNERSQFKNKAMAMSVLKARLYEKELEEKRKKLARQYEEKKKIEWGSQIRSYVLHPYSMVKDHRTTCQTSNAQGVLDGDIDSFIEAYLKMK